MQFVDFFYLTFLVDILSFSAIFSVESIVDFDSSDHLFKFHSHRQLNLESPYLLLVLNMIETRQRSYVLCFLLSIKFIYIRSDRAVMSWQQPVHEVYFLTSATVTTNFTKG